MSPPISCVHQTFSCVPNVSFSPVFGTFYWVRSSVFLRIFLTESFFIQNILFIEAPCSLSCRLFLRIVWFVNERCIFLEKVLFLVNLNREKLTLQPVSFGKRPRFLLNSSIFAPKIDKFALLMVFKSFKLFKRSLAFERVV